MSNPPIDHRKRVTKLMIRKAFLTLLSQKPIQSISIKELCALAEINRGTFYAHYQDIHALLEQIEAEMVAALQEALAPLYTAGPSGDRFLVESCTRIFQCLKENTDLCIVMLGEHSDKAFVFRLLAMGKETCLRAYPQHFSAASSQQIEYFYAFVSEGCLGLLRQWLRDGMALPAQEVAGMAETIMLHGIGFFSQSGHSASR